MKQWSKTAAIVYLLFLGGLGIQHFVVSGKTVKGIIYFLTGGIFAIGTIIDIIQVAQGTFLDADGNPWGAQ